MPHLPNTATLVAGRGKGRTEDGLNEREAKAIEPEERKSRRFDQRPEPFSSEIDYMKIAPASSLGLELDPIPAPPFHVRRLMLAMGTILDGYIDQDPDHWHPSLQHSMVVPSADI